MSAFHELEQANARAAELTEQNAKLRKALDGRRRETRRARRKLEAARAVLRAIADRVDLMESEIADHQGYEYDVNDHDATYRAGFVMGGYAEHEQITHELRELLEKPATRQAQSEAPAEPGLPRLATPDQVRDALRGGPLVDGVRYPELTMDEALGFLADRVKPGPAVLAERVTVPRSLLADALPPLASGGFLDGYLAAKGAPIEPHHAHLNCRSCGHLVNQHYPWGGTANPSGCQHSGCICSLTPEQMLASAEPTPTAPTVPVRHGWTRHGYACCGWATIGDRPTTRHRCLGNPGCPECKTEADQIHAGLANGGGQQ